MDYKTGLEERSKKFSFITKNYYMLHNACLLTTEDIGSAKYWRLESF